MAPNLGILANRYMQHYQGPSRKNEKEDDNSIVTEGQDLSSDPFFIMSFNIAVFLTKRRLGERTASLRQGEKLEELTKQMLLKHEITFNKMAGKLTLTPENVIATVEAVGQELFLDGCNFGRVVAAYALFIRILEYCLSHNMEDKVEEIQKTTAKVITDQKEWMMKNGGWVSRVLRPHFTNE